MVKKIIYIGIAIVITAGAAYSYERARFGERTVVFFRWVLAGENDQRFSRGRGGFERRRESLPDSIRARFDAETRRGSQPTQAGREGEEERPPRDTRYSGDISRDDMRGRFEDLPEETRQRIDRVSQERGDGVQQSSREFRGRGGRRGRGSDISLREVAYYALILSFATMATYWVDQVARKAARARQMRESR